MHSSDALIKVGQVIAEDITEASELSSALVGEAELEGARGSHGIERLQPRVVAQDVQHTAVGLPQEFEPGCHLLPVCPVLQAQTHSTLSLCACSCAQFRPCCMQEHIQRICTELVS